MGLKIFFSMIIVFMLLSTGFCQEPVSETNASSQDTLVNHERQNVPELPAGSGADLENPYSKGIGQKVVGWVLAGSGAIEVGLGLILDANNVYSDSYAQTGNRDMGETLEKIFWIEGLIQLGIGIPFIIVGSVQNGKWQRWEIEHKGLKVSFTGTRVIVNF
jgi:hypothetical protein